MSIPLEKHSTKEYKDCKIMYGLSNSFIESTKRI